MSQNKDREILALDQWKFYAQTTLDTSERRLKNNRFYIRLLLGLLAAIGAGNELGLVNPIGIFFAGIVGFPMCILWYFHILSYKQLNSGKYKILKQIADDLPNAPFEKEWEILGEGKNSNTYITHTSVEVWWPRVIGFPFAIMILYGGLKITGLTEYYYDGVSLIIILWIAYVISVLAGYPIFGRLSRIFDSAIHSSNIEYDKNER